LLRCGDDRRNDCERVFHDRSKLRRPGFLYLSGLVVCRDAIWLRLQNGPCPGLLLDFHGICG
jgi:hypothetical protein